MDVYLAWLVREYGKYVFLLLFFLLIGIIAFKQKTK